MVYLLPGSRALRGGEARERGTGLSWGPSHQACCPQQVRPGTWLSGPWQSRQPLRGGTGGLRFVCSSGRKLIPGLCAWHSERAEQGPGLPGCPGMVARRLGLAGEARKGN